MVEWTNLTLLELRRQSEWQWQTLKTTYKLTETGKKTTPTISDTESDSVNKIYWDRDNESDTQTDTDSDYVSHRDRTETERVTV